MIDIDILRKSPEVVRKTLQDRHMDIDIGRIIQLDEERRRLQKQVDDHRALKNKASERIGAAKDSEERKRLIADTKSFDAEQDRLEKKLSAVAADFETAFSMIPNIPLSDVPIGKDESENKVLRTWGERPKLSFEPKSAQELGRILNIIDTERAGKVSGSRFGYIKGKLALLQLALVRYAMDTLVPQGFVPVLPPVLIREKTMRAMGYLDRHADEIYKIEGEDLRLVGTSEQAIIPMHMDETLDPKVLPIRYVAYSPCFRRESGSYGKDTKGILRVHQFDKVEMLAIVAPEMNEEEHQFLLGIEEKFVQSLALPYQVLQLCTGDLGGPSARTFDIECWLPSEKRYRETHSCSTTTDFQTRRLNIRVKGQKFAYALNATLATGRLLIAILENYQQPGGTVRIPEILQKYCGFDEIASLRSP